MSRIRARGRGAVVPPTIASSLSRGICKNRETEPVPGSSSSIVNTIEKLLEISSRIDHLENAAEWIARETVHTDTPVSQTGSLICSLAEDLRERICSLVKEVEEILTFDRLN